MIYGDTRRLEQYRNQLPCVIYECLEHLRKLNFRDIPDGKSKIGEYTMSVESTMTEDPSDRKLEGHLKNIDVVFLIDGEECIGIDALTTAGSPVESYPDRDLYFYGLHEEETVLLMKPGYFAICFPEDLHRPLCMGPLGKRKIRKVVVKVPVSSVHD